MGSPDPPDRAKLMLEPKFLIMKRTDDSSMANISPFLIKKCIDSTCNGEVLIAKKTRDGNLLIKTKNALQANKLLKLQHLGTFPITVNVHATLNVSKGVIYSNDLRSLKEEEIKNELQAQNVCDVRKILKKVNGELQETGLVIITFASHTTPENIKIGYELVKVRAYIPPPLRCNNCFRFGHISKLCRNKKSCINCANEFHTDPDTNESCSLAKSCINCKDNNLADTNHSLIYRRCPIFVKHQEIQAIKITEKVDVKAAMSIYNSRHPHDGSLYSSVAKINSLNYKNTNTTNPTIRSPHTDIKTNSTLNNTEATRKITTYTDLLVNNEVPPLSNNSLHTATSTTPLPNIANQHLKIYPKNMSNKLKAPLKAKEKQQAGTSKSTGLSFNISDDEMM